ncbi:MAG: hypothetical protein IT373_07110 [Polyangiaceae bacterium]|nr:hypothetical protein [Polyangiaceae bacterium]
MGHHILIRGDSTLVIRDADLALVRHFLLRAATTLGVLELARSLARWDWQGPGVWIGVEEAALEGHADVFDEAVRQVHELGAVLSLGELEKVKLQEGAYFTQALPSELVLESLCAVRRLFEQAR